MALASLRGVVLLSATASGFASEEPCQQIFDQEVNEGLYLLQVEAQMNGRASANLEGMEGLDKVEVDRQEEVWKKQARQKLVRDRDVELVDLHLDARTMPWEDGASQPLCKCSDADVASTTTSRARHLVEGLRTYCNAGLNDLSEFYVDKEFIAVHDQFKDSDGWLEEAFVTYVGLTPDSDKALNIAHEADLLLQSVHRFSSRPVVVANFGSYVPREWTAKRFPQMILLHGRSMIPGKSFNYNKIRSMIFSKVKTGIVLDADQWINAGADYMFARAAEEGGEAYPYPILPVHWLTRDPDTSGPYPFQFKSSDGPERTMRWGHAHPTWTYEAIGFLARWSAYVLAPEQSGAPEWLRIQPSLEDEGMFNVALWAENKTKQWCKFDIPFTTEWPKYTEHSSATKALFPDSKWFPRGIPYMFFTAHDAKNPDESLHWLQKLWPGASDSTSPKAAIYYDGNWFASGKELHDYDPTLRCIA